MIIVILAVAVACGTFSAAYLAAGFGIGWCVFDGILAFGAVQGVAGFLLQKRVKKDMERVQAILLAGQKKLQSKTARWQMRPPGSIAEAQREIFADTKVFVREALKETESLARYRLWVPLMARQMATAQLQLHWMVKEFKDVDALMPKALFLDPTMSAIKMARLYMTGAATSEIEKVYRKAVRRLRYNQNVLLAALWSWILVRREDIDGAFRALTEALKNSDDATLKQNHQFLMNNLPGRFSNANIGDPWYSLFLEEPKVRMQRPRSVYR